MVSERRSDPLLPHDHPCDPLWVFHRGQMAEPVEHDQSRIGEPFQKHVHIRLLVTVRVLAGHNRDWAPNVSEVVPRVNVGTLSKDLCFDLWKTAEGPAVARLLKAVVEVQVRAPMGPMRKTVLTRTASEQLPSSQRTVAFARLQVPAGCPLVRTGQGR